MRFNLLIPRGVVFSSSDVTFVMSPSLDGTIGILPGHCPLISCFRPGKIRISSKDSSYSFSIGAGVVKVSPDDVVILCSSCAPLS